MNPNFSPIKRLQAAQELQTQEVRKESNHGTGRSVRPRLEYETAPETSLSRRMLFFNYPGANESGCTTARRSQDVVTDSMIDLLL